MKTCGTLFSGGGLADVGLRAAGYTPVLAVEYDEAIAGVYADNHGAHVHVSPVEAFDYRPYSGLDLLWASPSCVNASVAKTDAGETEGDRAAAAGVCRAIREIRPRLFVLENVWGYRKFDSFHGIVKTLWELGFAVTWDHINSASFGVHQTRKRLILRAVLNARRVPELTPTHSETPSCGSLFGEYTAALPWGGWYAAVEDLLPSLPESKFADWQLARLEAALPDFDFLMMTANTQIAHPTGTGENARPRPANCVHVYEGGKPRAFLMDGDNAGKNGPCHRLPGRPAPAVSRSSSPVALLVDCVHRTDAPLTTREGGQPSHTVCGSLGRREQNLPKALLINGQNAGRDLSLCDGESPAFAVTNTAKGMPKGLLVHPTADCDWFVTRQDHEPAFTSGVGQGTPRALLVSNAKTEFSDGIRDAVTPAFATTGEQGGRLRALLERGRVVSMTARCLARFQSVPDTYRLPAKNALAYRVVGNGVPSLLAQRIAESLEGAH